LASPQVFVYSNTSLLRCQHNISIERSTLPLTIIVLVSGTLTILQKDNVKLGQVL